MASYLTAEIPYTLYTWTAEGQEVADRDDRVVRGVISLAETALYLETSGSFLLALIWFGQSLRAWSPLGAKDCSAGGRANLICIDMEGDVRVRVRTRDRVNIGGTPE